MRHFVVIVAVIAAGCSYGLPTAPTPVAEQLVDPAATARTIAGIQLTPGAADGAGVPVMVGVVGTTSAAPYGTVVCSTDRGRVEPAVLTFAVGRGGFPPVRVTGATVPVVLTCRSDSGAAASIAVNLSAWSIHVASITEQLDARGRWETRLTLQLTALGQAPATARTINWGDGRSEPLPGGTHGTQSIPLGHIYGHSGDFEIRARVDWSDSSAEARGVLTRNCYTPVSIPTPNQFGICSSTWRELP